MRTLNACSLSALVGRVMTACEEVVRRVALPVQALVAKRCDAHCLQFLCSFCQVSAHLIYIASLQSQVELQTSILFPTAAIPIIMSATFCPLKKKEEKSKKKEGTIDSACLPAGEPTPWRSWFRGRRRSKGVVTTLPRLRV